MKRAYTGLMALAMVAVAFQVAAEGTAAARGASVTVPTPSYASGTFLPTSRLPLTKPVSATGVNDGGVAVGLPSATKMVENYFNGLTTLQASFSQHVSGESFASDGTFYLKRPRQFLWQYDTPVRQKIVGTGTAVYYIDQTRNQVTQLPMNAGLARLFSSKQLVLTEQGLRVTAARTTADALVATLELDSRITKDEAGVKSIKLTFDRLPVGFLQLRRIEALDTLGATTSVSFANVQTGVNLNGKMFQFTPGVYKQAN